jgi:uncharacterized protein (DUF1330 family)
MAKAYMIAFVKIDDFDAFGKNYIGPSTPILEKHGGKLIAASNEVIVKEESVPPGWGILIEFPSMEAAEAFYTDPDYQPLIDVRRAQGGSALAIFAQGMGQ